MAFFAVYPVFLGKKGNVASRGTVLLALQPLLDEERLDAKSHIELISCTLNIYGKELNSIMFTGGDNVSTNGKIARLIGSIGCASHKFNLAVEMWFRQYSDLLSKINTLVASKS